MSNEKKDMSKNPVVNFDLKPTMKQPQTPPKTPPKTPPSTQCTYFWLWVPFGVILLLTFVGPWYHDCGHLDCSPQRNYGLYCDNYCFHDHYGPGASTGGALIFIILIFMFLWVNPFCFHSDNSNSLGY